MSRLAGRPKLEGLDPLIETEWEMCELSQSPQSTQDKI